MPDLCKSPTLAQAGPAPGYVLTQPLRAQLALPGPPATLQLKGSAWGSGPTGVPNTTSCCPQEWAAGLDTANEKKGNLWATRTQGGLFQMGGARRLEK